MIYVAYVCLGLSTLVAFANLAGCIGAVRRKRIGVDRGYSTVPLVSLVFSFGAWAMGGDVIGLAAFLPALADPGTWVIVVSVVLAPFEGPDQQREKK